MAKKLLTCVIRVFYDYLKIMLLEEKNEINKII